MANYQQSSGSTPGNFPQGQVLQGAGPQNTAGNVGGSLNKLPAYNSG